MLKSNLARRPLWLITKQHLGRLEVLTTNLGGNWEALPVFSFEEEAEMFLRLGARGAGWRAREVTAGELISVLYGPCAHVEKVTLDPPPEILGDAMFGLLVSLSRKEFVRILLPSDVGHAEPRQAPLRTSALVGLAPAQEA
ncbi:MAG: hypothetical protein LC751_06180 [Actinobacteria bacterium]|nr:hypothetical protein [Actinomycetota bacterium]MCA1739665.1 hypothetical protein [Actinomycetota bacterium]